MEWCEEAVEDGLGACESVDKAVGISSTARLKLKQARKNRFRCPLFTEVDGLVVEEELSAMARHGYALLGGRRVDELMERRAAEGAEEADL